MRRTTVILEDDIFQKVRQGAVRAEKTLKDYLNNLLRVALTQKTTHQFRLKWKTIKGRGQPRVSLEDRDRLFDFLGEKFS